MILSCFCAEIGLNDSLVGLDCRGRAFRDLDPIIEYDDVIGDRHHQIHVVLDHEDRDPESADLYDELAEFRRLLRIEAGRRLVEEQKLRLCCERASEFHPALQAIWQAAGWRMCQIRKVHGPKYG